MLFEKIETTRGNIPHSLTDSYDQAKREFIENNFADNILTGKGLVRRVSSIVDSYLSEYTKSNYVSCKRGCSLCCKQLICCTRLEMEVIIDYLNTLMKATKKDIKKNLKKEAVRFATWTSNNLFDIPHHSLISDPIRAKYQGKPCVFLNRNMCRIYPIRPIICRVTKVDDDGCGKPVPLESNYEGQKPLKLFYDHVAVNLIKEEEIRLYGEVKMLPIVAWPLTPTFKKYFF